MGKLIDLILEDAGRVIDRVDLSTCEGRDVLITGASGLLGVHLLACLHLWNRRNRSRFTVTAVTQSGLPDWLAELTGERWLRLLQGDLADPAFCSTLPSADLIFHSAGYAQPGRFLQNRIKTIQINTTATITLAEKLRPKGQFLFVSSSEVYSGSTATPYRESDIGTTDPGHVRGCYIEGKRCGEAICHAFRNQGQDFKICRLALTYGPGTRRDDLRVLNTLIRQGLLDGHIALRDRGMATRTCGYVSDAVELLLAVLLFGKQAVYNVGGCSSVTIRGLAEKVAHILGTPLLLPQEDLDTTGAAEEVALDLTRVCNEFRKREFVSLDEGLHRTIAWQKELYVGSEPAEIR
jgi:UDP-glucuronate decarboxylase